MSFEIYSNLQILSTHLAANQLFSGAHSDREKAVSGQRPVVWRPGAFSPGSALVLLQSPLDSSDSNAFPILPLLDLYNRKTNTSSNVQNIKTQSAISNKCKDIRTCFRLKEIAFLQIFHNEPARLCQLQMIGTTGSKLGPCQKVLHLQQGLPKHHENVSSRE